MPVVAMLTGVALLCRRLGLAGDARAWAESAAAVLAASLALLLSFGFARVGDPAGALWPLALYALLASSAAVLLDRRWLSYSAAALLLLATIQGVVFRFGGGFADFNAWVIALLMHASATSTVAAGAWLSRRVVARTCRSSFGQSALASSVAAALVLAGAGMRLDYPFQATAWLWVGMVWAAVAWLLRLNVLCTLFQVALGASLCLAVTGGLSRTDWFQAAESPWLDPWYWQSIGVSVALYALAWRGLRMLGVWRAVNSGKPSLLQFSKPHWAGLDQVAEVVLFAATVLTCVYAAYPSAAQELSPSVEIHGRVPVALARFEAPHAPSSHAGGGGGWALLAAAATLSTSGLWGRSASLHALRLLVLVGAAGVVASAAFAGQVATASALRWLLAVFALVASATIWLRDPVRPRLRTLRIKLKPVPKSLGGQPNVAARRLVIGSQVLLYLLIAAFVSFSCIYASGFPGGSGRLLFWLCICTTLGGAGWLVLGAIAEGCSEAGRGRLRLTRGVLALAALAPVLVVLAFVVATNLAARPLIGPDPASWFAQIGNASNYGGPLALGALVLLGYAVRERSSGYAFGFGLLSTGVAMLVFMLQLAARGRPLDAEAWIAVLQLNAGVLAAIALGWWAALAWGTSRSASPAPCPLLLKVQSALALVFAAQTLVAGLTGVFWDPRSLDWEQSIAHPAGLMALVAAALAVWLTTQGRAQRFTQHHVGILALLVIGVVTAVAARYDTGGRSAYQAMFLSTILASTAMVAMPTGYRATPWVMVFASLLTVLALRDLLEWALPGKWQPWWGIASFLAASAVMVVLAMRAVSRWPVWLAAPALGAAVNVWWMVVVTPVRREEADFLPLNIIVLGLSAMVSVLVEQWWNRDTAHRELRFKLVGWHRLSTWLAIAVLLLVAPMDLMGRFPGGRVYEWLSYSAIATALAAAVACLWDRCVRWPVAAFYLIGLAGIARFLGSLHLTAELRAWAFTLALSAFVLATSYLWGRRDGFASVLRRCGAPIPEGPVTSGRVWVVAANSAAVAVLTLLVFSLEATREDFTQRMTAAYGLLACALALGFLATGRGETLLRYAALSLGALFAVAFGWSWAPPSIAYPVLHRLVASAVALAALTPVYGEGVVKIWPQPNNWSLAAQKLMPALAVSAGSLLLVILGLEASYLVNEGGAPLAWPAVLAVALALAGLAASAL
ncbi:MAG: hypothetical protein KDA37_14215, partial [Planctomycetales bacterium]|nr:hypothetical protein [Planctomycetales bacterium]